MRESRISLYVRAFTFHSLLSNSSLFHNLFACAEKKNYIYNI